MAAHPEDLLRGRGSPGSDGTLAVHAIDRLSDGATPGPGAGAGTGGRDGWPGRAARDGRTIGVRCPRPAGLRPVGQPLMADAPIAAPDAASPGRPDRPPMIAFAADGQTEIALRDGLAEAQLQALDIRRGGIRAAIAAMQKSATPRVLIVDIGGQDEPLGALGALAEVTEPDVVVLVVGDPGELDFYRAVTRGLGAREYLPKPLTRDKVALHFAPVVSGQAVSEQSVLGSQVITVTGARGGAGASTVALNLAWHFGVLARRHTVLLDPDLHMGVAGVPAEPAPRPRPAAGAGSAGADRFAAGRARRDPGGRPAARARRAREAHHRTDLCPRHRRGAAGSAAAALQFHRRRRAVPPRPAVPRAARPRATSGWW